jgi:hypothetical protein
MPDSTLTDKLLCRIEYVHEGCMGQMFLDAVVYGNPVYQGPEN